MESILSFDKEFDINVLDQLIENQNNPKASDVLNRFMNHQLAWSRINQILLNSRNEKTHYFALTILERVIKRQWLSLTVEERHPVLMLLLSMVGLELFQQSSPLVAPTNSTLIRKKANSLIAQIIVNEYPNWNRFIDSLITITKQQTQILIELKQKNSTIESLLQIFKDFASNFKDNIISSKENTAAVTPVFNAIFVQCRSILEVVGPSASYANLSNETIVCLTSMFELIDISILLQSFPLLIQPTIFSQNRLVCVLALIEFTNVLSLPQNIAVNVVVSNIPEIFISVVKILSDIPLPKNFKEINSFYVKNGVLLSNISSLLIQMVKSFTPILKRQQQQQQQIMISQSLLLAHTYITLLAWSNDPLIFTPTLEFWKCNFSTEENQFFIKSDPFYIDLIQPICRVIYKILKLKDIELIDNRESKCRGVLYKEEVDDLESEEWIPLSNLLSTTLLQVSLSYPSLVYKHLLEKLIKITKNENNSFSSSKFSSLCWCLSKCLNFVEFEKTRSLIDNLYQYKEPNGSSELVYLAILCIIRNATNYLESSNTQALPFINLLFNWINQSPTANGNGSNQLEMSIQTLLIICQRRANLLVKESTDLLESINQIIYSNNHLSIYQKNILFECVGLLVKSYPYQQLPSSKWLSITDPLNKLLLSKSFNENLNLELIGEWSNHITRVLSFNNSLAKTCGPIYLQQLYNITPHLLELYKWTLLLKNDQSYQNYQLGMKKAIIDLIETNCNDNVSPTTTMGEDGRQIFVEKCLIPFFSIMVQDQSLATPSSITQLLPRILQLMTAVYEKVGSLLPFNISQFLTKTFLLPSLGDALVQSTQSKGQQLINRIWNLISIILKTNIISLTSDIIISYIKLLEICLINTSPTIHINALNSLSNYLYIVEQQSSNEIKSVLFDKNLLFDLMIKLLDNLIGLSQDFSTSQERFAKVIFELFMVSSKYLPNFKALLTEYYQSKMSSTQMKHLGDLFTVNSFDQFEKALNILIK